VGGLALGGALGGGGRRRGADESNYHHGSGPRPIFLWVRAVKMFPACQLGPLLDRGPL